MLEVLIIDDLKSAREMIRDILISDPLIHICGMADNENEAVEMVKKLQPHLVLLDSHLRQTSGYDVAEKIMQARPTPIVMVTAASDAFVDTPDRMFSCGVLDVIKKGDLYCWRTHPDVAAGFIRKIKLLSKVNRVSIKNHCEKPETGLETADPGNSISVDVNAFRKNQNRVIAIVSSTGGPNALFKILRNLPSSFPVPILIVQHMSPGFIHGLAEWLNHEDHIRVRVADDKDALLPGEALLAPDNVHLTIDGNHRVKLIDAPPLGGHRPSGTTLLKSIGEHYGRQALGVILTGMGNDGAQGMAALKAAGGKTIAQDQKTSVIFGMPKTAINLGAVDLVLPLLEIAPEIVRFAKTGL
jgi:two-component system, chemotaxis family, protein-glutamate methylesterase/glutaminase